MRRLALALSTVTSVLAAACGSRAKEASCDDVGKHLAEVGKEGDRELSSFRSDRERAPLAREYTNECVQKRYSSAVRQCLLKTVAPADIANCTSSGGSAQPANASVELQASWRINADDISFYSLATNRTGNTAAVGIAGAKASFGGTPTGNTSDAPFVAVITAKGTVSWQRTVKFPSPSVYVAIASDGTVWMSGVILKPSNELGAELHALAKPNGTSKTGFLIAWSATGDILHQYAIPGAPLGPIAVASDGDVLITSTAEGKVDVGGGSRDCGGSGILLARLHPDGSHAWSACASSPSDFTPSAEQETKVRAITMHDSEMLICGEFATALTLGTTIRSYAPDGEATPQPDLFVAALNAADGKPRLWQAQGGPAQQSCRAIAAISDGIVIGAAGGNELIDREHGDYSYVEPTVLHFDATGKRDWGWVDEKHRGAARMVSALPDGRIASVADDGDGASFVILDQGGLVSRTSLNGAAAVLQHEDVRIRDVTSAADGSVIVAAQALETRDGDRTVPGQSFVTRLIVRP